MYIFSQNVERIDGQYLDGHSEAHQIMFLFQAFLLYVIFLKEKQYRKYKFN